MGAYGKLTSCSSVLMNGSSGLAGASSNADARALRSSEKKIQRYFTASQLMRSALGK